MENYIKNLKKSEQKLFQKVVSLYPTLRPMCYKHVVNEINKSKLSQKSKEKMLEYNKVIYSDMFDSGNFLKNINEFSVGDCIYVDVNKERYIEEFVEDNNQYYIIPDNYNPLLDNPIPLYMVSHTKRDENSDVSIFKTAKEDTINDHITKDVITSEIQFLIKYISENQIDLNPPYQRDYVWTIEQKQSFIKALVQGKTTLKPTYLYNNIPVNEPIYEVLDGKQRINAVLSYMKHEFSINGLYYHDLSAVDAKKFLTIPVEYTRIKYFHPSQGHITMSLRDKIELFLQINEYGQRMSDEDLEKAKSFIK